MRKIRTGIIIIFFAMFFFIVACEKKSNEESEDNSFIDVIPEQTAKEPVKESIIYASSIENGEITSTLINMFNEDNQRVSVKYQALPYDEEECYKQILLRLTAGNWEADVFSINSNWCAEFASKGYLLNLNSYLDSASKYIGPAVDSCMYEESLWAMPQTLYLPVLYYRTDIFAEAPTDKEEFTSSAKEHIGKGGTIYGYIFAGKNPETMLQMMFQAINFYGGQTVNSNGELSIYSDENIDALNSLYDMCNGDFVPETIYGMTEIDAGISFLHGESLFMKNSYSMWEMCNNEDSKIKGRFDILPAYSPVIVGVSANAVNKASDKEEFALEFIEYLSEYDAQKASSVINGSLPVLKSVFADSEVIKRNPIFTTQSFEYILENSTANISSQYYMEISENMIVELYLFLNGEKTAEQALLAMQSELYSYKNEDME